MKMISEENQLFDASLVGGKGSHLQKLISWGANVPAFFIVTTDCYDYYISNKTLPPEVRTRFNSFLEKHPEIALRSSMISEDNVDSSFAGLFETLLNVTRDNWEKSLLKIYESLKSDRVQEYVQKKNIEVNFKMAVVAQKLIRVERSGVLFSRAPVSPTSAVAIDAAFGMGEGVVSGTSDVDHYQLTRTGEIIERRIQNDPQVLSPDEMKELVKLAIQLESKTGRPSDIEWGYKEGTLYVFQIRPITRAFEPLTFFVDTNLSESYPGVVSPFTAGFVKKAYENVFKESAVILGASSERLQKLNFHYENLITSVDDHLYYNLEHYYAVLRALPGGEKNIDNWHKMIGGRIDGHNIPIHETKLSSFESVSAIISLLKIASSRQKIFRSFLANLESIRVTVKCETSRIKDPKEIIFYLNHLINRPLGFGLTIINDVFVMIGLGFLTQMLKRKGFHEDQVIDLLRTNNGVDSLKPLEQFNNLIHALDERFLNALSGFEMEAGFDPYKEFFQTMRKEGFCEQVRILESFISTYGDRSFEELKLESLPLKNNPLLLKQLILWARKNDSLFNNVHKSPGKLQTNWLEKKIIQFTRSSIETREATRLWRGKFYHLMRELVLNLGLELKNRDPSWKSFSIYDFFSLSHEEWQKFATEKFDTRDIQQLMIERRPWQTRKRHYPEVISWSVNEPLPVFDSVITPGDALKGQGVSQGTSEGYALVLESPDEALSSELKNFILVTKNTDPAWVYIMSRSLGLISEKGSLLSHTAIIGRELNIPTLVGVKHATRKIKTGDKIRLDATNGTIEFI